PVKSPPAQNPSASATVAQIESVVRSAPGSPSAAKVSAKSEVIAAAISQPARTWRGTTCRIRSVYTWLLLTRAPCDRIGPPARTGPATDCEIRSRVDGTEAAARRTGRG